MSINLLITFIVLNIINVVLQTFKSIATVKCGKVAASVVNALAYGLYTVVIIYMSADLPLVAKALIVALCNLIGVYVVKAIEEKMRKDKLWKIELTVKQGLQETMIVELKRKNISFSYVEGIGKYTLFNCYSSSQEESTIIKAIALMNDAKYFVSESKVL